MANNCKQIGVLLTCLGMFPVRGAQQGLLINLLLSGEARAHQQLGVPMGPGDEQPVIFPKQSSIVYSVSSRWAFHWVIFKALVFRIIYSLE